MSTQVHSGHCPPPHPRAGGTNGGRGLELRDPRRERLGETVASEVLGRALQWQNLLGEGEVQINLVNK